MFKFFRHIRQKLLEENRFSKYLFYAIGEIILVVIGILIALQINNWNENKKKNDSESLYYQRLLEDFELEKASISALKEDADQRIKHSKRLIVELNYGTKDKYYIMNAFLKAFRSDAYVPKNVTFKDLISSGNLSIISDLTIKNSLIQFYGEQENVLGQINSNRDEKVKVSFDVINNQEGFGIQEFDYLKRQLEPEILEVLPNYNWIDDKSSETYKRFQNLLLFNITMSDRDKQHLDRISNFMETPYRLLQKKCGQEHD
ncbi:MAG: DUF6090 family protein [Bacteroidota bacterium]